ncbi:MAG TPA: hypothetical protein VHE30_06855 [Polyangiaceae bacterium]|nr:hypothetical protein [Polyangiaceae bacterium]
MEYRREWITEEPRLFGDALDIPILNIEFEIPPFSTSGAARGVDSCQSEPGMKRLFWMVIACVTGSASCSEVGADANSRAQEVSRDGAATGADAAPDSVSRSQCRLDETGHCSGGGPDELCCPYSGREYDFVNECWRAPAEIVFCNAQAPVSPSAACGYGAESVCRSTADGKQAWLTTSTWDARGTALDYVRCADIGLNPSGGAPDCP